MLFTWLMLTGFIFLLAPQSLTSQFQFAFVRLFCWPLGVGRNISLSAQAKQPIAETFRRKEAQYQNYIINLEEELKQQRQKLEQLSGLRSRRPLEGASLVFADVITATLDGIRCEFVINRGQDDGLRNGQFVFGDNSIIGTVSEVSSRTAKVKLITDPVSKIAVKIAGVSRLMQGIGKNLAEIEMIKHKVETGTYVRTEKKPGYLDSAMVVGKVVQCESNEKNPLLWDLTVKPACEVERLNKVAVIIMNLPKEAR